MKYDCSKTSEFMHEHKRICAYRCDECPLFGFDCGELDAVNDEYIRAVQKWSDEHPDNRETNGERFIKILKNAFNEASDLTNEPTKIVVEFGRNTSEFTDGWLNLPYEEIKENK